MRENKHDREEEIIELSSGEDCNYMNESTSASLSHQFVMETLYENQHVILNQPGRNEHLVYQVQKVCDQDQNQVFILVPSGNHVQIPLSILQKPVEQNQNICYINSPNEAPVTTQTTPILLAAPSQKAKEDSNPSGVLRQDVHGVKQKMYHCDFPACSQVFASFQDKKLHVDAHLFPESTDFKCGICNARFERAADRNKHVESHVVAPTLKCRDCAQDFTYFTGLLQHLRKKRVSTAHPIKCFFCQTRLTDFDGLVRHHHMTMRECECGAKKCGTQLFEWHTTACRKKWDSPCEQKRMKKRSFDY